MNTPQPPTADILIVDDTLENLHLLSEMLTQQGYDIRIVKSGAMALRGVQAQPPDLILLDIMMPEMDGYEVCQRLKANPQTQNIPVIFISALHEVFDKVKAFAVGGVDYITKPFQIEEVCARVAHQLTIRHLQMQVEEMAIVQERNRIARDIHDSLGHALVALNLHMETALTMWNEQPDRAYPFLVKAKQLGSEALQAVRQSVSAMRDDPLQGQGLTEAIAHLIQEFYQTTGVQPNCQIHLSGTLSQAVNIALYRIVQEGLTNICKYAKATAVEIQIESNPAGTFLKLEDNGKGFQMGESRSGFGLQGMQERVTALGGSLEITSARDRGCCINAYFPVMGNG
ncbi:ATP-binding response regulator [Microcoleus sp. herbarium12]|uniref:ATP-binding response regulator n=1 Tax=Microcoleus sp. herbarium12 TaxID=3055437 RepID=UPI002FD323D5